MPHLQYKKWQTNVKFHIAKYQTNFHVPQTSHTDIHLLKYKNLDIPEFKVNKIHQFILTIQLSFFLSLHTILLFPHVLCIPFLLWFALYFIPFQVRLPPSGLYKFSQSNQCFKYTGHEQVFLWDFKYNYSACTSSEIKHGRFSLRHVKAQCKQESV